MNLALRGTPLFSAADSGQDIAADTKKQSSPQSIRVKEMVGPVKSARYEPRDPRLSRQPPGAISRVQLKHVLSISLSASLSRAPKS